MYMYVCICMYVCMYVHTYIYIYGERVHNGKDSIKVKDP